MEQWVHFWFHSPFHYHLCYPIRHGWHARRPLPSVCFWYLYHAHRWWKVAARRHSIPDFVEVLFQPLFKVGYRFFVYPCRSFIRFYSLIRLPDLLPGDTKWLCLTHRLLPLLVGSSNDGSMTQPLRSILLSGTSPLLRVVPSLGCASVLFALMVLPFVAFPFASQSQVATFRSTASCASSGHLCTGCRSAHLQALSELIPQ